MANHETSDNKTLRVVLFVIVAFACIAAAIVGAFAGWKAGTISLVLLMLPAATIYRSSGMKSMKKKN
ncbi:hypothetical protein [Noviherbaspirillum aerium]|uniref:hypothetical protein n=1 Tax=Noviherbaspirillum aerium TaxID=2588497 RepID=UPI00124D4A89|nr:hypothetical protein [Noviherbaspirillum aerium]